MATVCAHLFISGRVQGVSFRYATYREANRLRVAGWVRNRRDRRVEAWLEGEEDAVRQLIDWCRVGPSEARVENVEVSWPEPSGRYREFAIEPSV